MKLLLENTCFLPIVGGTETYCYQFLTNINSNEIKIRFLCQFPSSGPSEINNHEIIRYGEFDLKSGYDGHSKEIDASVGMGRIIRNKPDAKVSLERIQETNLKGFYEKIFEFEPDIIFINDIMRVFSSPYYQFFQFLTEAKLIVNLHGILTSFHDFWEIRKDRKKLLLDLLNSDLSIDYIAPSKFVYKKALEWGIREKQLHQIYLGVDTSQFNIPTKTEKNIARKSIALKFRKSVRINPNSIWLSFPSRAVNHKGFDTALKALQRIATEKPELDWLFVVAGGSSDNPESILDVQETIAHYQLEGRVLVGIDKFLDFPYDMKMLHQASDLCLFPSRREALGYGALESMACGVPVIGASIPGLSEVFGMPVDSNGECDAGWVIKPEDSNGLASLLKTILKDPVILQEKKESTRKWIIDNFSVEKMINEHIELFIKLVSKQW